MTTHIHTYMSQESLRLLRKPLNNLKLVITSTFIQLNLKQIAQSLTLQA